MGLLLLFSCPALHVQLLKPKLKLCVYFVRVFVQYRWLMSWREVSWRCIYLTQQTCTHMDKKNANLGKIELLHPNDGKACCAWMYEFPRVLLGIWTRVFLCLTLTKSPTKIYPSLSACNLHVILYFVMNCNYLSAVSHELIPKIIVSP